MQMTAVQHQRNEAREHEASHTITGETALISLLPAFTGSNTGIRRQEEL